MPHLPAQPQQKLRLDYKTNIPQNCKKNQAIWKSNNQGFKEDTFIQMGRRSRDTEMHEKAWKDGEAQKCGMGGPTSTCGG